MVESFTVFWTTERARHLEVLSRLAHPPVFSVLFGGPHLSQPSFVRAGVKSGDEVYIFSLDRQRFRLWGRMQVASIVQAPLIEMEEINEAIAGAGWPLATRAALSVSCTTEIVRGCNGVGPLSHVYLGRDAVRRLRYMNQRGERTPKGIEDGRITSPLAFRGIYRLAQSSARDLAAAFASRVPPSTEEREFNLVAQ